MGLRTASHSQTTNDEVTKVLSGNFYGTLNPIRTGLEGFREGYFIDHHASQSFCHLRARGTISIETRHPDITCGVLDDGGAPREAMNPAVQHHMREPHHIGNNNCQAPINPIRATHLTRLPHDMRGQVSEPRVLTRVLFA